MTRIQPLTNPTGKAAELLQMVEKKLGRVPNMMKTLAQAPAALEMYLTGSQVLGGSSLSAKTREQLALLAAKENSCDYCTKAHSAIAKHTGLSEVEIQQSANAEASDPKTQALLKLSQTIIRGRGDVSDAELAQARTAGISDAQIIEVIAATCFNIFTNYVNHVAQPEIDF